MKDKRITKEEIIKNGKEFIENSELFKLFHCSECANPRLEFNGDKVRCANYEPIDENPVRGICKYFSLTEEAKEKYSKKISSKG